MEPWSFNQPVLLNKTRHASSVLVWTLVGATGLTTLWAFWAPLPETVMVQGKLQPLRPAQAVTAPVAGVVDQVTVKEGQQVQAGTVLLHFDTQKATAQRDAGRISLASLERQFKVNQVLLGEGLQNALTPEERELYRNQEQEQRGRQSSEAASLARSQVRIQGLERSIATAETVAERYQQLLQAGASSELQVLSARERLAQLQSDLEAERRDEQRLSANQAAGIASRNVSLRKENERLRQQMQVLRRQISEAELLLESSSLTASTDGVVFDLQVRPGSVVQRGDSNRPLLRIVPTDALQAKVYIPNSAIGFVQTGQRADISLIAFPAGDFSDLPATVQRIGSDALTPEQQRRELGLDAQGLHFPAILKLSSQTLQVGRRSLPLHAGMSLTASLHLRDRRFISAITGLFDDKRRSLERLR